MRTATNTAGARGLWGAITRAVSGGGLFMTEFTSTGGLGAVAFAAKLPGADPAVQVQPGRGYLVHRHGFLCAHRGRRADVGLAAPLGAGVFGGEGLRVAAPVRHLHRLGRAGRRDRQPRTGARRVAAGASRPCRHVRGERGVRHHHDQRHFQRAVRRRRAVPGAADRAGADLAADADHAEPGACAVAVYGAQIAPAATTTRQAKAASRARC